jgi:predicted esterase
MQPTLIALHGYTMNGARLRALGSGLFRALEEDVTLVFPDAPLVCAAEAAQAAFAAWRIEPPDPPHLRWWRASDDGSAYEGWERARDSIRALIPEGAPCALLGFSQGAILAATLAALSARGEFPELHCAVLIAGAIPRARELAPLFDAPVAVPSLHVWGERDALAAGSAPRLAARFQEAQRETAIWPGSHTIPPGGDAFAAIVRFVRTRLRTGSWSVQT